MKPSAKVVMFSKELKEGTSKSHSAAENTKFVSQFLKGCVDPDEYRKLISNFYYVYNTMEGLIKETNDPLAKTLQQWQLKLIRTTGLERDLRYFYGPMWREYAKPSEACNNYCHRLNEVAEENPYLLIAHHYTRYIGDLSGGVILKGIAEKALNTAGQGMYFYEFPYIDDAKAFKNEYRATLDGLGLDESQKDAIIAEANYAFKLNMDMFNEIQGSASKSLLKIIWSAIRGK